MLQEDQRCRIPKEQPDMMLDNDILEGKSEKLRYILWLQMLGASVVSVKLKLVNLVCLEPDRP